MGVVQKRRWQWHGDGDGGGMERVAAVARRGRWQWPWARPEVGCRVHRHGLGHVGEAVDVDNALLARGHVLPERLSALLAQEHHLHHPHEWVHLLLCVARRAVEPLLAAWCTD